MMHEDVGHFLVAAGAITFVIGLLFLLSDKLPLGKLPGDIAVGKGDVHFLIPVTTIVLVSIAITLVLNFMSK